MVSTTSFKVFLVEDEVLLGEICSELLAGEGYDVHYFSDAESAINSDIETVDLLISDMRLPGISGTELAKQLSTKKKTSSGLPLDVMFVSGDMHLKIEIEGFKPGSIQHLLKPFSTDEYLKRISEIYLRHSAVTKAS